MRLREGTVGQKALFGLIVSVFFMTVGLVMYGTSQRMVGGPNWGFLWVPSRTPPDLLTPARAGVAEMGLVYGSRWEIVNGVPATDRHFYEGLALLDREIGAVNDLTIRQPGGARLGLTLPVTAWTWGDAWFVFGENFIIGTLFFLTCVLFFLLRPYEATSWALLCGGTFFGAQVFKVFTRLPGDDLYNVVSSGLLGVLTVSVYHGVLAFPVPHRLLKRVPRVASWLYVGALPVAGLWLGSTVALERGRTDLSAPFEVAGWGLVLLGACLFVGRQCVWAVGRRDRTIQQRARLLVVGYAATSLPIGSLIILQVAFGLLSAVPQSVVLPLVLAYPLALGYAMVRNDMFDARIAVRRAGAYALAGAAAAGLVWAGAQVHALLAAACLLPVLYLAPRFHALVTMMLYPKRMQYPDLLRSIGDELAAAPTRQEVVEILASAPQLVCDTDSGAAFFLPKVADGAERISVSGETQAAEVGSLADEPLIHLLVGGRRAIKRESLGVDPQFALIKDEAVACMDRLRAAVLLPIVNGGKVVGGLAVGPHTSGDVYDPAELAVLSQLAHQAAQALDTAALREERDAGQAVGRSPEADSGPGGYTDAAPAADRVDVPAAIAGDRYVVKRWLGEGAYKRVYLAHDQVLGRDVALALLKMDVLEMDAASWMQREARTVAQLGEHPNIVPVYDVGEAGGQLYVTSQFLPGGSVAELLAQSGGAPLPLEQALRIGQDVCAALELAHANGILHGDLRPRNVLLTSSQTAKLCDFSVERPLGHPGAADREPAAGTAAYLPPEHYTGQELDARSDLYGFGVMLYEMLTGRLPFTGADASSVIAQHIYNPPPLPTISNPALPAALSDLTLALLAKDPAARPASAAEVSAALAAIAPARAPYAAHDATVPVDVADAVPDAITGDRYVVKGWLGEGAFKRVYLAYDTMLDRDVALALVKMEVLDESGRQRLRRELRSMGRLGDHQHIVTVHDVGEADGQTYLISQYMAGGAVSDVLDRTDQAGLPLKQALRIGVDVCRALEHAHAYGIIHRDLKPGNVWLTGEATAAQVSGPEGAHAMLGDFGLAAVADQSRLTKAGQIMGTAAYMAPEQARGADPDARTDLYALGVMLYEMTTGRVPFAGGDIASIIAQHLHNPPVPPITHTPTLPPSLNALILALLVKEPAARMQTATDVRTRLEAILAEPMPSGVLHEAHIRTTAMSIPATSAPTELLVGRETELARAQVLLGDALAGQGKLLLLAGEPGIGKTRLATECAQAAAQRGARVLWGRCYEGEGAPAYWPWVQILRTYVVERDADLLRAELGAGAAHVAQMVSDVQAKLPEVESAPELDAGAGQFLLFDSVVRFLKNAAMAQPLVLILDDLHWADPSSLLLLQFLARALADGRLFVLGTYRDAEVDRDHPLAEALGQLVREPVSERLHLTGLSEDAVATLIQAQRREGIDAALAHTVYERTAGNPFFIKETLRHLEETGAADGGGGVPAGVRDVIRLRLARLSERCVAILTMGAVVGRDFGDVEVEAVSGFPMAEVWAALEDAEQAGLIREVGQQVKRWRFIHALIRETLYDDLGRARRAELHRQIGEALARLHADHLDPYLPVLAFHFAEGVHAGADVDQAVHYNVRAAKRAMGQTAFDDGVAHFRRALETQQAAAAPDEALRCQLYVWLGYALTAVNQTTEAMDALSQAIALARKHGLVKPFADAAFLYSSLRTSYAVLDEEVVGLVEEGLRLVGDRPSPEHAMLLAQLSICLSNAGREPDRATSLSEDALDMAREQGDSQALLHALGSRLESAQIVPAERAALAGEMAAVGRRINRPEWLGLALMRRATAGLELGDRDTFGRDVRELVELVERVPWARNQWNLEVARAVDAVLDGRFSDAAAHRSAALKAGRRYREKNAIQTFYTQEFLFNHVRGTLPDLGDIIRQAASEELYRFGVRLSVGLLHVAEGDMAAARAEWERLAGHEFADLPEDRVKSTWLSGMAEIAVALEDAPRARLLYDLLTPYADLTITMGGGSACMGSTQRYLGLLAGYLERWGEAEAHFEAAIELNARLRARPFVAHTQYVYARMLLARGDAGDQDKARDLLAAAAATADELGMPRLLRDARAALPSGPGVAGRPEPEAGPGGAEDSGWAGSAGFVGRDAELARARAALTEAVQGQGQVLLLVGEPGIGKTRLATECAAAAAHSGARVLWGRCFEGEGAPAFWPWVQILRRYVADADAQRLRADLGDGAPHVAQMVSDIRAALPEIADAPPLEGDAARFLLFDAVSRFLKNAAAVQPLMLVLDDLHWADTSSLLLLQFLAGELADAPLFILGTYRDVEVDKDHPLAEAMGRLVREPVTRRIHLGGLSEAAVGALVEGDDPAFAHAVYAQTEGNPFFIQETVRHLQESGGSIADMGVPAGVRDVIRLRVARLPDACRELLTIGAVVGRECERAVLLSVRQWTEAQLLDVAAVATRAGLIEDTDSRPASYRFVHALIRETIYDDLQPSARAQLHREVGNALESLHANNLEPHLPALAHHCSEALPAGVDAEKAIAFSVRAAERATAQMAFEAAVMHYERALHVLQRQVSGDPLQQCTLMLELSRALINAGDVERVEETLFQTCDLARRLPAPELFAEAIFLLRHVRYVYGAADEALVELIEEGLGLLPEEDSAARASLLAQLSRTLYGVPDTEHRQVTLSADALAMARRVEDAQALTHALRSRHNLIALDPTERAALASELVDLATEKGRTDWLAMGLSIRSGVRVRLGDVTGFEADVNALIALADKMPLPENVYVAQGAQVVRAILFGHFADAEQHAVQALESGRNVQVTNAGQTFAGHIGILRWLQGRLPEVESSMPQPGDRDGALPIYRLYRALVNLELGRQGEAQAEWDALAAQDFADLPHDWNRPTLLALATEVAAALDDGPRAAHLYAMLLPLADETITQGTGNFCLGSAEHWLGVLAALLDRWAEATAHFEAAGEMNARMRARPFVARTQYAYARMLLARGDAGDQDKARGLLTEAAATAEELGMATLQRDARAGLDGANAPEQG